jgi:hypothetical protein
VKVKGHEIDDALARDSQPLPFLHFKRRAGIFRHDLTLQNRHVISFQHTPAKHGDSFIQRLKMSMEDHEAASDSP